ncbi:MAG: hypothetical protein MJE66_00680 [Proteobacteria bacterium]|nr:hypothetical protein [Pseudomonadota bacterium]
MHTRISEQLSDDIRRIADEARVPVSNLVRNVLEEVFSVVESVSDDVGELVEDVLDEAEAARDRFARRSRRRRGPSETSPPDASAPPPVVEAEEVSVLDDVLGWQTLLLNHRRDCAGCGRALERGQSAYLGVSGSPGPSIVACAACAGVEADTSA